METIDTFLFTFFFFLSLLLWRPLYQWDPSGAVFSETATSAAFLPPPTFLHAPESVQPVPRPRIDFDRTLAEVQAKWRRIDEANARNKIEMERRRKNDPRTKWAEMKAARDEAILEAKRVFCWEQDQLERAKKQRRVWRTVPRLPSAVKEATAPYQPAADTTIAAEAAEAKREIEQVRPATPAQRSVPLPPPV